MYQKTAQGLASLGRGQDKMLVHMTPGEVQGLQKLAVSHGGSLTINPHTGLPEAGFLSSILPTLVGAGVGIFSGNPMLGAAAGAAVGGMTNQNHLQGAIMGGIGAYGGASLGAGLGNAQATEALVGQMGTDAVMTPGAYRDFLTNQVPSTVIPPRGDAAMQGFKSLIPGVGENVGQNWSDFIGTAGSKGAGATGLGGGMAAAGKAAAALAPLAPYAMEQMGGMATNRLSGVASGSSNARGNIKWNGDSSKGPIGYYDARTVAYDPNNPMQGLPSSYYSPSPTTYAAAQGGSIRAFDEGGSTTHVDKQKIDAAKVPSDVWGTQDYLSRIKNTAAAPIPINTPLSAYPTGDFTAPAAQAKVTGIQALTDSYRNGTLSPETKALISTKLAQFGYVPAASMNPLQVDKPTSNAPLPVAAQPAGLASLQPAPMPDASQSDPLAWGEAMENMKRAAQASQKSLGLPDPYSPEEQKKNAALISYTAGTVDPSITAGAGQSLKPINLDTLDAFMKAGVPDYKGTSDLQSYLQGSPQGFASLTPQSVTPTAPQGFASLTPQSVTPTAPQGTWAHPVIGYDYESDSNQYGPWTNSATGAQQWQTPEGYAAGGMLDSMDVGAYPQARIPSPHMAVGGLEDIQEYTAGGKLLRGDGDGMSDSIPAVIKGAKPQRAALADGEFVVPADVVSHLGNGSTEAGAKRLYSMLDKVRHARTGNKKQGRQINPDRFMPA